MLQLNGLEARSLRARLLGCSLAALAAGAGSSAWAACTPLPVVQNGVVNCTGATVGGLTVDKTSLVNILSGASLSAAGGDLAAFRAVSPMGATYGSIINLNVQGAITGGSADGVLVNSGEYRPGYYWPSTRLNITVGTNATIQGATAIRLQGTAGNRYGLAVAELDNSGQIRSTSGPAIVSTDASIEGFFSITNRRTGYIGGIQAGVQQLNNAGVIDGGAFSALSSPAAVAQSYAHSNLYTLNNDVGAEIRSNSTTATVRASSVPTIVNGGLIANRGSGAALEVGLGVTLTNSASGVISSGGAAAIQAGGPSVTIYNRGLITGSIVVASRPNVYGSTTINTLGGRIAGDVLLGDSDDLVIGTYDAATRRLKEISGRVDGGGGLNTLQFTLDQSIELTDGLMSADYANFQAYRMALAQGTVLTLNGNTPVGLSMAGYGSIVTNGAVTSTGTAFMSYYAPDYYYGGLSFTNNGSVTSTVAPPAPGYIGPAAINLSYLNSFVNSGSIVSSGAGVLVGLSSTGALTNYGSISAVATALSVSSGTLLNEGEIRSTGGLALYVSLGGGTVMTRTSTNNGVIEGVTAGAQVSSIILANSGTITASNGHGVVLEGYSRVDNLAGGVISGSKGGVRADWASIVSNAGVINGDVTFSGEGTYIDAGGQLNGSLTMSNRGDRLLTDLDRLQDGKFSFLTGAVDAGDGVDQLILRAAKDAEVTLSLPTSFEALGLELSDDAAVKALVSSLLTSQFSVAGQGSLDLTADITTTTGSAIRVASPYEGSGYGDLSLVSRGALQFTEVTYDYTGGAAVELTSNTEFENAGSINVALAPQSWWQTTPAAIRGGEKVTNSGVITLEGGVGVSGALTLVNTGEIRQVAGDKAATGVLNVGALENSGVIEVAGAAVSGGYYASATIQNDGVIRSTAGVAIQGGGYAALIVTNNADGLIEGKTGAIAGGYYADTIRNDGKVVGTIDLGYGDDRVENYGTIEGAVLLGDGNDTFVQWVGAKVTGVVNGGAGLDTLTIDSTGGGSVEGANFINFERFTQIGDGELNYSGHFAPGPINLVGGAAKVLAGTSVSTTTGLSFTGSASQERITIEGSVSGGLSLGGGADSVVNRGAIGGSVLLGSGDDTYTERAGATLAGVLDGGDGVDTFLLELAGDHAGLRARTGFERLGVSGSGVLGLALDQNWDSVALDGAGVNLALNGFTVGAILGGDADESVTLDGDVADVRLGGGGDRLTLASAAIAGVKDGGLGDDVLTLTAAGPTLLTGVVNGFERIEVASGSFSVAGVLGAGGDKIAFGDGAQTLTVLSGGVLKGAIDLGAGDDTLHLQAGGNLEGQVLGGAGADLVRIDLLADLTLDGAQLQQFETLQVTGAGALNFTGSARFDRLLTSSLTLNVGAGAGLASGSVQMGGGDNLVTVAGQFAGALDLGAGDDVLRLLSGSSFTGGANGGTGYDRLELALGGTDAAPVALGSTTFTGFEALALQSGVVSLAGDYGFDSVTVSGGRLIGLAGSRLSAANILVQNGATFGSAGAVVGNLTVAGVLSPGASPGTMTLTGNLAMASGSSAVFELGATSDRLDVWGAVSIASNTTLKLVGDKLLAPGRTLDLITAGGGLTGRFTTVEGAQALSIHLRQGSDRLQAVGLFTNDQTLPGQAADAVGAFNAAIVANTASAALVAAMPTLTLASTGRSDAAALIRVTPQAYASALQLGTENGLTIIDAARAQSASAPETAGLFGFGQAMLNRRTLDGDAAEGVAGGKVDGAGVLAGVGYGARQAWAGGFVGYLDGRERLGGLDARTETRSFVAGVQGGLSFGDFALGGVLAHDSAEADTRRALPGGASARAENYKLKTWSADLNLTYAAALNGDWLLAPSVGVSWIQAQRAAVSETGGGAFALSVNKERLSSLFVDAQVTLVGGQAADARLRPHASIGLRSLVDGDGVSSTANLGGVQLRAAGVTRADTLATAGAGVSYQVKPNVSVSVRYAGEFGDGGRQSALLGVQWAF
ncbi:hypothetical protein SGCZBJ_14770 [Caulobacter zeae]|uniref:Autotransporter domain-containing protein n=1 Tax=Caulobacter zeae TaxID=2055137 RepID=A0A2N5DCQ1_9CAUL|nr:autotransporter outer membrane beta-barrel domain-containing protein [Caulobacter zeae]PLR23850.1 hypothetical protein SGCZBJ_14770 [Caulobacter zeae]